ncbi:hypothetical protein [Vibrio phage phiKT1024]|nr:hypothetical protein [Vibrio phage phiKT1024]
MEIGIVILVFLFKLMVEDAHKEVIATHDVKLSAQDYRPNGEPAVYSQWVRVKTYYR